MPSLVRDATVPLPIMNRTKTAPAVQAVGSPPKEVRFAPDKKIASSSRERTEREAWSFYWFETHCKDCQQCQDPYSVYKRGELLCPMGDALARDMSLLVFMRDGEVYERLEDINASPDRVEIPHNYQNLMGQLKVMDKIARHRRRRSHRPVVQYDQEHSRRSDERRREDRYYPDRIIREEKPRSAHKSEKKSETSRRIERAEVVVEQTRPVNKAHDDDEMTSGRRRRSHSANDKLENGRVDRGERAYLREGRPRREPEYRQEERPIRTHRHSRDNEIEVELEMSGKERKYRTEIRKPDKEQRRSYYH